MGSVSETVSVVVHHSCHCSLLLACVLPGTLEILVENVTSEHHEY